MNNKNACFNQQFNNELFWLMFVSVYCMEEYSENLKTI